MQINESEIRKSLQTLKLPGLDCDLVTARALKQVNVVAEGVEISIELGFPPAFVKQTITEKLQQFLKQQFNIASVKVDWGWKVARHRVQNGLKGIDNVKNIIAVASGKGGVGKSTTAVNLALALNQAGARVGILDADIYGPNQPHMLGSTQQPKPKSGEPLQPVLSHGLQSMSIGYLIDTTTPMIWRGPMVSKALQQLTVDTQWDNLDYLFVDLPPGTGDIQLTLAQKIPVSGAVIITTPQDVALLDARKGLEMFNKVSVAVLGIVENMSGHVCTQCGYEEALFGSGGGQSIASATGVPLLGQLPLALSIREAVDQGCPTVAREPESAIAKQYQAVASRLAARLSLQDKDYAVKFPDIVVESQE